MVQLSRTTVHHVFHGRYSSAREDDEKTIPLCDGHHQGEFDTSKIAIHREKARWAELYGEDYTYLPEINRRLEPGTTTSPKTKRKSSFPKGRKIQSKGFETNRGGNYKMKIGGGVQRR